MTVQERISKIRKEIAAFRDLQGKLGEFGAWDSEPDYVFRCCMKAALKGVDPETVPTTADGWQLYSSMASANPARRLASKTRKIVRLIQGGAPRDAHLVKAEVMHIMGFDEFDLRGN